MKLNKYTLVIIFVHLVNSFSFGQKKWGYADPIKLGNNVNTDSDESYPIFSKDSSKLFFVRSYTKENTAGEYDQDIWFSNRIDKKEFELAKSLKALNNNQHNAVIGINQEGNKLYLLSAYEGRKDKIKGIAYSTLIDTTWGKPVKINIPNLIIKGNYASYNFNRDESVLIISHQGDDTKGEEDLYYSIKDASGNWSEPASLGDSINTQGFEISPYLSENSDTLYFSSNGHGGLGDADIFYSVRKGTDWNLWSKPVNMGDKINSTKFDAYFIYSSDKVYWSSDRDNEHSDIYMSYLLDLEPLSAEVEVTKASKQDAKDGKINLTVKGGKGPYTFEWDNGKNTEDIDNLGKGKYKVKITDSATGLTFTKEVEVKENLPSNLLDTVYFEFNKFVFNADNISTIEELLTKMKGYHSYKIKIESHCDQRGSASYNMELAIYRATTIRNYLIEHGVDEKIIYETYKGIEDPIVGCYNCTEKEYYLNRSSIIQVVFD